MNPIAHLASSDAFALGEGPVWDARRRRLMWVDIVAGAVHIGALDGLTVRAVDRLDFDGTVGAVAVADDGTLLVAAQERLVVVHTDGRREDGPRIVPEGAQRRLNDGSTDPAGRFLVGTLSLAGASNHETLVRVDRDRRVVPIDSDLTLSNGLAWSADGTRLYSVDTMRSTVFVRSYDAASGTVGERREHLRVANGYPDGIALDADEHLWVAVWGAGEVRRFAPDGTQVGCITVPAPHTSCVAFAGDDLRTLVITTATDELDDAQLRANPDSGRLFTTRVDTPGLPVPSWSGFSQ
jgi:sugar lactone lactonase YvrE